MPVQIDELAGGKAMAVSVTGKLTHADYEQFMPTVERLIAAHGKLCVLVEMHDFHGWTAGALWDDVRFDMKHFKDIQRLAIVGESQWEKGMATFCKPFTTAEIRYFDRAQREAAREWVLVGADVEPRAAA